MYCFWLANAISQTPSRAYAGIPYAMTSSKPGSSARHSSRTSVSTALRPSGTPAR